MKKTVPRISEAEWAIMKILWRRAPQTAAEIASELPDSTDWSFRTVKALISRLMAKGALRYAQEGRKYLYSPAVGESECMQAETKSFLDRLFDGSVAPLLSFFVERESLSAEEIEQLRKILRRKGDK